MPLRGLYPAGQCGTQGDDVFVIAFGGQRSQHLFGIVGQRTN